MADHGTVVRLIVGDHRLQDIGEAVARLRDKGIAALALKSGDRVEVTGRTVTSKLVAPALPAGPEDDGLDLIRLDGTQRRQLGVQIGERVEVRRHASTHAQHIRLIAIGDLHTVDLSTEEIRRALGDGQVAVGDTLTVTPNGRVFDARVSLLGIELASIAGSSSDTRAVVLRVVATRPEGVVAVTPATEIEVVQAGSAEG
jgi:transitional endoplasmic reticulum ATPase